MNKIRQRVAILPTLKKITPAEHQALKVQGALNKKFWNINTPPFGKSITDFREETKNHYYFAQLRACCYCSIELVSHQGTFDAEHIIDKNMFPQFMFDFSNLAVSCKTCNGAKSNASVLASLVAPLSVPLASDDYIIVHPHIDEWDYYFFYDSIGRIVAKIKNGKAENTIRICGINYRNAARLADHFYPAGNEVAERALNGFFRVTSKTWKRKYVAMLRQMANGFKLSSALAIVNMLEKEI
ncbi:hypothetical protein LSO07_18065 [Janthinobacterium sp. PLB04]|uniref:HNH endonuclease n=1 Tax=Janthinobacterium lividum TaxID=29581 RepID=A0AAJ4MPI5_9BURK|nr:MULTISPECIES: hypothetical protein [Janthinobacterium]KAB0325498.1 hypothetical protein F3B38_17795 [Janthinobacterium lividum]QSX94602.1 hypothetical protein J3P46_17950 [Janthinobacterium lividum]UGQ34413.1 hypothetical protein LSO07_18065 [Janthinobacterium sp. PLB04]